MYLKSLEMQGFKSFPDKTKLIFEKNTEVKTSYETSEKGVTVIVGPNGSGKSNIADAMRWVLGEISTKTLRGAKMEDVIFGGADSRRPMGYAEVSVTFDNRGEFAKLDCPYDEVIVTRRYYRSGDSEYFINRKGVRLKDIYELFMNTGIGRDGYSIIGQGRIAEMVSRKSEERRSVFEDASGIAKYRYEKNDSERKLKIADDNLARANDIFAEVAAQVGPLEKESERAKRALELLEKKKQADVSLWLYDTEKLRAELTAAEELMQHAAFDLSQAEDAIQSLEAQTAKLFEASQGSKQASETLLTKIRESTENCHRLESKYQLYESSISHAKDLIATTEGRLESVRKSLEAETDSLSSFEEKMKELHAASEALTNEETGLSKEQIALSEKEAELAGVIEKALEDIRALESEAVDVKVRISVLENAKISDKDKNQSAITELEGYRKVSDDLTAECERRTRTVENYDAEIAKIDREIAGIDGELEQAQKALQTRTEELNSEIFKRDSIKQRIATFRAMEENFEGYSGAVRFVMKQYEEKKITDREGHPCGKIYGPLSQLISVEDKFITAIEVALGNNLQHIVVADEDTAKNAMFALKKGEGGRATFFPLTSMTPPPESKEVAEASGFEGYIGLADELVNCEDRFRNVVGSLLGKIVVFDNIDHAAKMAKAEKYKVRAVTLDGQQVNIGGSFTGGSVRQGNGILSRAGEMKRLEADEKKTNAFIARVEADVKAAKDRLEKLDSNRNSTADRKELILVLRNTENGQLDAVRAKLDANRTLVDRLASDMKQYEEARARYDEDLQELSAEEKRLAERIREITDFRNEKNALRGEYTLSREALGRKMTDLQIRISGVKKDIETEQMLKEGSASRSEAFQSEISSLEEKIRTQNEQIRNTREEMEQNRKDLFVESENLQDLNAKREEVEKDNFEFERKLNELNQKLHERMNRKELVFREYTKCESKLNSLRESQDKLAGKLIEDYELTRADAEALGYPPITKENRPEMIALQTECRNKLRAIGNVDLDAVNKYAEVKTRYDYLHTQITDLETSRKELTGIIDSLESQMKVAFVESFNQINEHFGKVFAELFGGGSAELSLTDPDNVLESGIEIKAAPPGKIIKNLMQLSGGEQAFIGVALFFAILQVNPTPFCILDEIEAALDEVNVERLAQYIKRYSEGTQFIMITHRRGTMAAADRLYGITMPEHGISKVLMLDTNDISKKEGEDWNGIFG